MESWIPEEIVEEIRQRADIVEIISGYVTLQRRGKNYLGLCPFHNEKTPSFTVTPEKQMFHCFGCHVGGNVITFLMRKENWSFPETIQYLANKTGIALPEEKLTQQQQEEKRQRQRWESIHDWAANFFNDLLLHHPDGAAGRDYLAQRGVTEESIKNFRLGFSLNRWDALIEAMRAKGVKPEELVKAGLAIERGERAEAQMPAHMSVGGANKGKGYYDRFRNRVIFSILDIYNRPIAFGGRVLDDAVPKYLNSPETQFYNKGDHLYGIHQAYRGIREKGLALLVEGYMDVIALHQAGLTNTVASLGTALTKEQARGLRRYTERVVICYDSDQAGIQAALRAGEILRDAGLRVEVLTLTGAKDPDEFIKSQGVQVFQTELDKARTYVEFKYTTLIQDRLPQSIQEKAAIVSRLARDILAVKSPVEREGYERFLSFELGITLEAVHGEIGQFNKQKPKYGREQEYLTERKDISVKNRDTIISNIHQSQPSECLVPQGAYRAECLLLRIMGEDLLWVPRLEAELGTEFWQVPVHQIIFFVLQEAWRNKTPLFFETTEEEVLSTWSRLMTEEIDIKHIDKIFYDCTQVVRAAMVKRSVEDLQADMVQLEKAGDFTGAMALLKEIGERLKRDEK